ncbi:MAG: DNA topoisomerase [Oscillospiraceae bacterium]|nr:DNA topoisomerase [Oscillospiraceae bacterium]MDD7355176.1 DNA topoisomerase [Oscillospiraceae bacterium]MDY3937271.1 DNA topoisomerase [Oscillospiraceae bacterium]
MYLIIAEKPSLARNIAAGIGDMKKRNGYLESERYIVTWAFGHLFSLCDIEDYTGPTSTGRWNMENLPCFPDKFKFKLKTNADKQVDPGVQRQFDIIKSLCMRSDVEAIVNAGDADREGEIIIRLCVMNALESEKPFYRLWLPDQTPETVRKALGEMKPESEYDLLASEGFARTYIDWLFGVNLTRYATLKTGTLLRVGRVIVPIVKAIYDRDMAIRNFKPDIYYAAASSAQTNGETVELTSKSKFSKDEKDKALALCEKYNSSKAVVTNVKSKKDIIKPGKLYSLSKLQNVLGKKYKMSMEQSLKIVQKLYEDGYLTYPRTNSEYLATAEKDKIKTIIKNIADMGYHIEFKDKKTIFDDSKIESHSALTPTYKIPPKGKLSEDENKVYSTVFRRFAAVFCAEDCTAQKTELTVNVGGYEDFVLKGTVILEKGWMKYDDANRKDKFLPKLKKGDEVNIDFKLCEKETSPPKHYTIETLNNYLKNPFREEKAAAADSENDDDSEDYRAIFEGLELGTEATRTGIIDNAVKSGYIELKKDVYKILPGGEFLIESISYMNISMDKYKTSTLSKALKSVYHGRMTVDESVKLARDEISEVFNKKNTDLSDDADNGFYGDIVGKCPLCGCDVKKGRYSYGCTGYKSGCKFKVNLVVAKRVISVSNVKLLLETGKSGLIKGFVSKAGTPFDAYLKLDNDKTVFEFDNSQRLKNSNYNRSYSGSRRGPDDEIPEPMFV